MTQRSNQRIHKAVSPKGRGAPPPKGAWRKKVTTRSQDHEVRRLKNLLEQIPDVREKRIQEIRKLIQDGRYEPNLKAVSDKVLQALIAGEI